MRAIPMPDTEDARRGATIYSVADDAGVSIATVSRVLQGSPLVSDRTRQKVVEAMDRLDYLPSGAARSLAVRQHHTQGLVLPELSGPYYAELLVGFETRAAELDQSVMVVVAGSTEDRTAAVRRLSTRVDGIAVHAADTIDAARSPKPVVVIAGDVEPGVEAISAENPRSAQRLTEHLLDHGRTGLLFVGDVDLAADVRERHEGFVAAHRSRGLDAADPVPVELREHEGEAVADRLLSGELTADALVCGNDELALALLMRLVDGGVDVPGDVAVVGWDDVMTARYVRPGLTTVRQPVRELGALAADRLYDLVNGATPRTHRQVLPTELVLRTSCGCRPAPALPAARHPGP
jgi:LacI family transcriptional regulator